MVEFNIEEEEKIRTVVNNMLELHPLLNARARKEQTELKEFKTKVLDFLNMDIHAGNDVTSFDDFVRKQCAQAQANAQLMAQEFTQRQISEALGNVESK